MSSIHNDIKNLGLKEEDFIHIGKEHSNKFIVFLAETIFRGSKIFNNYFKDKAVVVVKEQNREFVKDFFKIMNNKDLDNIIPNNEFVERESKSFNKIHKWILKNKIEQNNEHWIKNFKNNSDILDKLNGDVILKLDRIKMDYLPKVSEKSYADLIRTVLGEKQLESIEELDSIILLGLLSSYKNSIEQADIQDIDVNQLLDFTKYFFEDPKIKESSKIFPKDLVREIVDLNKIKTNYKNEELFQFLLRNEVEKFKEINYKKEDFKQFLSLLKDFQEVVDRTPESDLNELKDLYHHFFNEVENRGSLTEDILNELKENISSKGLKAVLKEKIKSSQSPEIFQEVTDLFHDGVDQIKYFFEKTESKDSKISENDLQSKENEKEINQTVKVKIAFRDWLSEKKYDKQKADRIYNFFDRMVDKDIYSAKCLSNTLKSHLEKSNLSQEFMDKMFPKTLFGSEWDPLDVFSVSDGKKQFFEDCFKNHVSQVVHDAYVLKGKNPDEGKSFASSLIQLFKNKNVLPSQESLDRVSDFVEKVSVFTPSLKQQKEVIEQIKAKHEVFKEFDFENFGEISDADVDDLYLIFENKFGSPLSVKNENERMNQIKEDPLSILAHSLTTFLENLFPKSNLNSRKIEESLNAFRPLLNPILKEQLKKVDDSIVKSSLETVNHLNLNMFKSLMDFSKKMIKDLITFESEKHRFPMQMVVKDENEFKEILTQAKTKGYTLNEHLKKPNGEIYISLQPELFINRYQELINVIVDTNKIYRDAKKEGVDLNKVEDQYFEENHISMVQKWLLVGLSDFSKQTPFIQTIANIVPSFLKASGKMGQFIAAKVLRGIVSSELDKFTNLSRAEKNKMLESVEYLIEIALPLVSEIKKKHNLQRYTEFVQELDDLIHHDEEVKGEEVNQAFSGIMTHFLDYELIQYENPIFEALDALPKIEETTDLNKN